MHQKVHSIFKVLKTTVTYKIKTATKLVCEEVDQMSLHFTTQFHASLAASTKVDNIHGS